MVLWVPGERLLAASTPMAPVLLQPGHRVHRGSRKTFFFQLHKQVACEDLLLGSKLYLQNWQKRVSLLLQTCVSDRKTMKRHCF